MEKSASFIAAECTQQVLGHVLVLHTIEQGILAATAHQDPHQTKASMSATAPGPSTPRLQGAVHNSGLKEPALVLISV